MKVPGLLIRADAGVASGIGHVMRMLALAEAWVKTGGAVSLLGRLPQSLVEKSHSLGIRPFELAEGSDAAQTRAQAKSTGANWIAADGYEFHADWQREVRQQGPARLMIVDDNAENRRYVADCVLNVNIHANESMYADRAPTTKLLLGPKFVLIRGEVKRAATARVAPPVATRWLVTMGGSDPVDATGRFLAAVADSNAKGFELEVLVGSANHRIEAYRALANRSPIPVVLSRDVPDVTVPMKRADMALSASGGTVWELALMGVPAAVLVLAENQRQLASSLAQRGVVEPLGEVTPDSDATTWLPSLMALAMDAQKRGQMVSRARALVDGQGPDRVVQALQKESFDAQL